MYVCMYVCMRVYIYNYTHNYIKFYVYIRVFVFVWGGGACLLFFSVFLSFKVQGQATTDLVHSNREVSSHFVADRN